MTNIDLRPLSDSSSPIAPPLTEPLIQTNPIRPATAEEDTRIRTPTQAPATTTLSKMSVSVSFYLAIAIASIPMLLFGFNTGVLNAPESVIFPGHSVWSWSLAVSAFCVGGFLGSAYSGQKTDQHGRRLGILVILALNGVFGILHFIAPNMTVLIAARIGVGLAGGASTVLTPMYLSEVSPPAIKGSIGTLTQLSCVVGILASILYALPFCNEHSWRFIFLPLPVVSLLGMAAGYLWLPESPRWLLLHHYNTHADQARAIIRQFRYFDGEDDEEAVEMEVLVMTNNGNSNSSTSTSTSTSTSSTAQTEYGPEESQLPRQDHQSAASSTSFKQFALNPSNRIPLVSSILFPIAQQFSGINAVFYYSTLFFDGIISNPQTGTVVAFAVNVVATLVALLLMDKFGRKTLLSWSAGGMAVCCILLTFSLLGYLPPMMTVMCVMLYISFFELGLGCIPFFLSSELIQPHFLGTVQSISMASNWFANFCVGLIFPSMNKILGAYSFVPFGVVLLGTLGYAHFVLPETRGKPLSLVLEELRAQQPQRIAQEEPVDDDVPLPVDNDDAELL